MDKRYVFVLAVMFFSFNSIAQQWEKSVKINTGAFWYRGSGSVSVSQINYNSEKSNGYTNSPYGNLPAVSYGLAVSFSKITKSNFKFGVEVGGDYASSKVEIDQVWSPDETSPIATGETYLRSTLLTFFPNIGYRVPIKNLNIDIDAGIDVTNFLSTKDKGSATVEESGIDYKINGKREIVKLDLMPRLQLGVNSKKYGGFVSYSMGLKNHKGLMSCGNNSKVFGTYLRAGFLYKL